MGLKWQPRWPFSRERKKKGPKTVNIFLGFFFMVNYCLGTGFLGVPFSFFYAGYLASIPTLLLIAFVSWNNAEWEVETMARAQVCVCVCVCYLHCIALVRCVYVVCVCAVYAV